MAPQSNSGIRTIDRDASIVLLGMPGSGKSTLAVMLSVAFDWPIRESVSYLKTRFGKPPESFKKEIGTELYHNHLRDAVQLLLSEHESKCVIVCDVAAVQGGVSLLREFSKKHIVIHIERDIEGTAEQLRSWDRNKIDQLQRLVTPLFRSCANYEYYNITENTAEKATVPISHLLSASTRQAQSSHTASLPSLSLKSVERDFIKFACAARDVEHGMTWDISSPLSETLTEKRTYTYAVSVSLRELQGADIEDVATGSDAFEIVVDLEEASAPALSDISHAYARVRRRTTIPVILHVRKRKNEEESQQGYNAIVNHCLRLLPDYASIDLSCSRAIVAKLLSRKGKTKAIGHLNLSKHNIEGWHDRACLDIYNLARELKLDVVRLCLSPKSIADNFAIQSFQNDVDKLPPPHPPLIAYNTGLLGRTSICLNSAMTPVRAVGLASDAVDEEAPCITARESTVGLFGIYVLAHLNFWFVAANIGHTLSPVMHNAAFEAFGIPHQYETCQCQSLADLKELARLPSFGGLSVGPPFKAQAVEIVDSLSIHAQVIGAINTIIPARRKVLSDTSFARRTNRHIGAFQGADELHGDNTDWIGMAMCIMRGLSPVNAIRAKTSALVIGAGSMAKAAIYALLCLGVQNITISNRSREHAEGLASQYLNLDRKAAEKSKITGPFLDKLRIEVVSSLDDTVPETMNSPTIIISCIPVIKGFTLPKHWLTSPTGGVVLELGYESLTTSLVDQIWALATKGWVVLRGLDFLSEQGCPQFELFSGRRAPRRLMRDAILTAYRARHPDSQFSQVLGVS